MGNGFDELSGDVQDVGHGGHNRPLGGRRKGPRAILAPVRRNP
jgi:hypothetical protein